MIRIFRDPEPQEYFVIGSDPSEGGDYSTFVAISKKTAEVVLVGQSKSESSQLGHELNHVGRWLEKRTNILPLVAVERNVGTATLYVLKSLNYGNLFRMPNSFTTTNMEDTENYGWSTNTATRPKMLDDLALAIRQQAIRIPDKIVVEELYTFIRNKKTGKPEADIGSHDDLVMALAIAWQAYQTSLIPKSQKDYEALMKQLPVESWKQKSGFY